MTVVILRTRASASASSTGGLRAPDQTESRVLWRWLRARARQAVDELHEAPMLGALVVDYGLPVIAESTERDHLDVILCCANGNQVVDEDIRTSYYRYWEDSTYNASSHPGYTHYLKYSYSPEAIRRYDYVDQTFDDDFKTETFTLVVEEGVVTEKTLKMVPW